MEKKEHAPSVDFPQPININADPLNEILNKNTNRGKMYNS